MTTLIRTFLIGAVIASASAAHAEHAQRIKQNKQCTLVSDKEAKKKEDGTGKPAKGLRNDDLYRFSLTSERNKQWVQWYLKDGSDPEETLVKANKGKTNVLVEQWHDCDQLGRMTQAINDSLYHSPIMECQGKNLVYRLRPLGQTMELDVLEKRTTAVAGQEAKSTLVRVKRQYVDVAERPLPAGRTCPILVSSTEKEKTAVLKTCLPALDLEQTTEARVAMNLSGKSIADDEKAINCTAQKGFADLAKNTVVKEDLKLAPAAGPAPVAATQPQPAPQVTGSQARVSR